MKRPPVLREFLQTLQHGIEQNGANNTEAIRTTRQLFERLSTVGTIDTPEAAPLPVCKQIDAAAHHTRAVEASDSSPVARHAHCLSQLAGQLSWYRRKGVEPADEPLYGSHANAIIVGPGGIEQRDDVWIGCSVVAPGIRYPDHDHPPEEVYLVLSEGYWRQEQNAWFEPGIGGVVYNSPGIVHAMKSGERTLLATWCLRV